MRRTAQRTIGWILLVSASACDLDESIVPPGRLRLSVHAVLNPDASGFVVLVEEIRAGQDGDGSGDFGSGIPVIDARVDIYGPGGDSAIGRHDAEGYADGQYYFSNRPSGTAAITNEIAIRPGATYRLIVRAPGRPPASGTTTIPNASRLDDREVRFNRDRDTIHLAWPAAPGAKRYVVWVRGQDVIPSRTFTEATKAAITADRRLNIYGHSRDYMSVAETQHVLIAAVDSRYFDYYRAEVNPLTGAGLLSNIEGGTGLFGSSATIQTVTVHTVASQEQPIEGLYEQAEPASVSAPRWIDLYVRDVYDSYLHLNSRYGADSLVRDGGSHGQYYLDATSSVTLYLPPAEMLRGTLYGRDSIVGYLDETGLPGSKIVYVKRRAIP